MDPHEHPSESLRHAADLLDRPGERSTDELADVHRIVVQCRVGIEDRLVTTLEKSPESVNIERLARRAAIGYATVYRRLRARRAATT